jgi:hypothetical protein
MESGYANVNEIHLVPVGGGRRLLDQRERTELALTRVIEAPGVTHLCYRVTP